MTLVAPLAAILRRQFAFQMLAQAMPASYELTRMHWLEMLSRLSSPYSEE